MSANESLSKELNESIESDEEEEEPKLKYEWILGDLPEVLMRDGASCIHVKDKVRQRHILI